MKISVHKTPKGKFKNKLIEKPVFRSVLSRWFQVMVVVFAVSCKFESTEKEVVKSNESEPIKVIFETDMGNDIDDALALDMLYKFADQNKMEIVAINVNKNNKYAPLFIDLMNNWYGHPDIPIGTVINGADSGGEARNFTQAAWEHQVGGKQAFPGTVPESNKYPDAVDLYREVLTKQADNTVTVISVGFSTNLARLLESSSDDISELSGKDLVKEKVKLLSIMAGNFNENRMVEYNVRIDIKSAQKVFEDWPTPIVASPWELGHQIKYPASSIENDFKWAGDHPLVVAYENYLEMPYDRPTWDLTSAIYALEGGSDFFTSSKNGQISVDDEGYTNFVEMPNGKHRYLKVTPEQATTLKKEFVNIITKKPRNRD